MIGLRAAAHGGWAQTMRSALSAKWHGVLAPPRLIVTPVIFT
jgi:hypothetical protein